MYGPSGNEDIGYYKGFTLSSNFEKFGAIDDGEYTVFFDEKGKQGKLSSHWAVEGRKPVNCLNGINPSPGAYHPFSSIQKNEIFIHSSNKDGFAGEFLEKKTAISTGCLLIAPTQYDNKWNVLHAGWTEFNNQLYGVKQFKLLLKRD